MTTQETPAERKTKGSRKMLETQTTVTRMDLSANNRNKERMMTWRELGRMWIDAERRAL